MDIKETVYSTLNWMEVILDWSQMWNMVPPMSKLQILIPELVY